MNKRKFATYPVIVFIFDLIILKPRFTDLTRTPFLKINHFKIRLSQDYADHCSSNLQLDQRFRKVEENRPVHRASTTLKRASIHSLAYAGTQNKRTVHANQPFRAALRGGGGEDALAVSGDLLVPSAFPSIQVFRCALVEWTGARELSFMRALCVITAPPRLSD
jgi:hypothetical protein